MRSAISRAVSSVALLVVASGCDAPTEQEGSFLIDVSDQVLSIGQGKQDTIVITILRDNYNRSVVLDVDGAPVGVIATFSPKIVSATGTLSDLRLTINGATPPQAFTLTIRANGDGVPERSVDVDVTVGVTGDFTLGSMDGPPVAAQGGGANVTVLVNRVGGHADSVALGVTGLPSGVTATFTPTRTTRASTRLTLTAEPGAAVGSHPLTITGSAAALADQTTQVMLEVIAPPATASLTMPFCGNAMPIWFAYQNEGALWQQVSATGAGFTFNATNKVAVAFTYSTPTGAEPNTQLRVVKALRTDLAVWSDLGCPGSGSASGTASPIDIGKSGIVVMGPATANVTGVGTFSLTALPNRVLDLVAMRGLAGVVQLGGGGFGQWRPDTLVVQRAIAPGTGVNLGNVSFTSAEAFAPSSNLLTVNNILAGDTLNIVNLFVTGTATSALTYAVTQESGAATIRGVPAGKMIAGDYHSTEIIAFRAGRFSGRGAASFHGAMADRVETLPPELATTTLTLVTNTPYVRMNGSLPSQAEFPSATTFYFLPNTMDGDLFRDVVMIVTKDYLGGTPTTWEHLWPDFGNVTGFSSSWITTATEFTYQADALDSPIPVYFGGVPAEGATQKFAYRYVAGGAEASLLRASSRARGQAGPRAPFRPGAVGPAQYFRR